MKVGWVRGGEGRSLRRLGVALPLALVVALLSAQGVRGQVRAAPGERELAPTAAERRHAADAGLKIREPAEREPRGVASLARDDAPLECP